VTLPLTRERLGSILASFRGLTIGVLGDFTLDGYWYADMEQSQLSRETPLYPRPIVRETYSLGGSANVAWNVAALQVGCVWAFSVLGDDWRGSILRELLAREGIQTSALLNQSDRKTPFYGKVVLTAPGRSSQEDARLDFINTRPLSPSIEAEFLAGLKSSLQSLDALMIADYQTNGVVTGAVGQALLSMLGDVPGLPVVVDSRERAAQFAGLILKPNSIEASRLFFPGREPGSIDLAELARAALDHHQKTGKPVFITRGELGCLVCAGGECRTVPGVRVPPPIDTVGAGDSFLASLATALAAGAAPLEAACLANLSAAVTVAKIGVTGTASPDEILAMYDAWIASSPNWDLNSANRTSP
jgi:rfaE bifunctional protein kinase chain/domain